MFVFMTNSSRTAEYMALFRAIETNRRPTSRLFADPLARRFLPWSLRIVAAGSRVPGLRALIPRIIDHRWPGTRPSAIVRTRLIDDELEHALADGIDQVVVLGAGFDSRGVRIGGIDRVRVIEVDKQSTQLEKRVRLTRALGACPRNLAFVAVDFEHEDVAEVLDDHGFRSDEAAFVIWEGVTNYLTAAAVDRTFGLLARVMVSGSRVAFTYVHRGAIDGSTTFDEADRWLSAVRKAGEPWTFGFDPLELPGYLATRGFRLDRDVSTAEAGNEYLHPLARRDRASELYRVAIASRCEEH
jgi:methyltransferase (TIGR00027 family)